MNIDKNKINYLEGLRGLSCMVVLFDHCVNQFYPSLRLTNQSGFTGTVKDIIAWSPLNIIYSGLISVFIFFILSGFVLSHKYHLTRNFKDIINASRKRYFRLLIPVFFSLIFFWICKEIIEILFKKENNISFFQIIKSSFFDIFFTGENIINGPLWTMHAELVGSFIVFGILAVSHEMRFRWLVYLTALIYTFNTFYFLFILGALLSDLYTSQYHSWIKFLNKKTINTPLLILSLLFISYPTIRPGVEIGGIYTYLTFPADFSIHTFWHIIGVSIIFLVILNTPSLQKIFNHNLSLFLGKLSFSAYVLHFPILLVVREFNIKFNSASLTLLVNSIIVFSLTLIISIAFEKYIDKNAVIISNKIAKNA